MFKGMADEPAEKTKKRLSRSNPDMGDRAQIDAWFEGTGADVIFVVVALVLIVLVWKVLSDSLPFALAVVGIGGAVYYVNKKDD